MIDLYKDFIIDHGLNPRNKFVLKNYTHMGRAYNHFCGDSFVLYLFINKNFIENISFDGQGCSVSVASSSLMTILFKNNNILNSLELYYYLIDVLNGRLEKQNNYEHLNVLLNVKNFPSRVKCSTLIWHCYKDIIDSLF